MNSAPMNRGEFAIYGNRFRWWEESVPAEFRLSSIPLIRKQNPLATEAIKWFGEGGWNKPRCGKMGPDFVYRFEDTADFRVAADGSWVEAFFARDAEASTIEFVLSRGVLPRVLHLRGTTCLHASAVRVGGKLVAFCGASGTGKSSMAAALAAHGCELVTDDVLPLRRISSGILAGPGLPEIRIYPEAAIRLGIADQAAAPRAGQSKAVWRPESTAYAACPLARVYLLEPGCGGPPSVRKASAQDALLALLSNSFWLDPCETRALAADLACFAQLVRSIPLFHLRFEFAELDQAVAHILGAG